ncbi:MAG: glycoside hydrolase family 38 C-terminal domain-containing protein [Ignavibacteriaceae bacterium]
MDIKEILILHHSHFDVGYTHSQPIIWQLQYEFIEGALNLLDSTKDWDKYSKPRWTCEVTAQVMEWLKHADESSIEKFKKYLNEGRIGISGLEYNTTPNSNAEQLSLQLQNINKLKKMFGAEIKTVNQHDVNGLPWSSSDIMIDAGIELFIMATNNHFGGYTYKRPSVFRWMTPSKRELLVMNGAHYTMFDQLMDTPSDSLEKMEEGYKLYLDYLAKMEYDLDFIYLTTANAPVCYDNAPPNLEVANLVREWNSKGKQPKIRYITPNMLLDRIKEIDINKLVQLNGDWTDYWNYGCASTAYETKLNQNTKSLLHTAEMISTSNINGNRYRRKDALNTARDNINLFDEHTWGAFNSVEFHNEFVRTQNNLKKQPAYKARELTEYYLVNELENIVGNPESNYKQEGILVVNSSPAKKRVCVPIPEFWKHDGKRLRTARFSWPNRYQQLEGAKLYGPIELEPYSWQKIPFNELQLAEETNTVTAGDNVEKKVVQRLNRPEGDAEEVGLSYIESPYHRLEYAKQSGRITSLFDKKLKWEILNQKSEYTFFQFVREYPDPLVNGDRTALYARDLVKEKFDANCWMTDWKAKRETANNFIESQIERTPEGVSLVLRFSVPGAKFLEQRITLQENSALILLDATIHKDEVLTPESIYFTFPLNLKENWKAHYDTAGIHVELDEEQLPKSSRGWQTVESYASMYNENRGVVLLCPDAPMVQMGGFNFGRKYHSIDRLSSPLLLAWPLNNYWDTNFSSSQPGQIRLSYAFSTFKKFNKQQMFQFGREISSKIEVHPAMNCKEKEGGSYIEIKGESVQLLNLKLSGDGKGIIARVVKTGEQTGITSIKLQQKIKQASLVNTLEEFIEEIKISKNEVLIDLVPNRITQILFIPMK